MPTTPGIWVGGKSGSVASAGQTMKDYALATYNKKAYTGNSLGSGSGGGGSSDAGYAQDDGLEGVYTAPGSYAEELKKMLALFPSESGKQDISNVPEELVSAMQDYYTGLFEEEAQKRLMGEANYYLYGGW